MRCNLPEDVKLSLFNIREDGWSTYLRLCLRYNIDPLEFEEVTHVSQLFKRDILYLRANIENVCNFTPFIKLTLGNISSLNIEASKSLNGFSLEGLCQVYFPNLEFLTLHSNHASLDELEFINSPNLKDIRLTGSFDSIPSMNMPKLKYLNINNNLSTDIGFLKNSTIKNLEYLSITNPTINESPIRDFDDSRLSSMENLKHLHLTYTCSFPLASIPRITGKIPAQIEYLDLYSLILDSDREITLPYLSGLSLFIESFEIFKKLNLPKIKFIHLQGRKKLDSLWVQQTIRSLLRNKDVLVAYLPAKGYNGI